MVGDAEFFAKFLVQNLVQFPEHVVIEKTIDENGVLLSVIVDGDDMGRVIGKNGATAQAIRVLLHALDMNHEARYSLKIVDVNPKPERKPNA